MNNFKAWFANFRYRLASKLQRFMAGRYSYPDDLYKFLTILTFVLIVIGFFINQLWYSIIIWVIIGFNTFRLLSKNHYARTKENKIFLKLRKPIRSLFVCLLKNIKDKQYAYRRCPKCYQIVRLPKGKGKGTAHCPKCNNDFKVRV